MNTLNRRKTTVDLSHGEKKNGHTVSVLLLHLLFIIIISWVEREKETDRHTNKQTRVCLSSLFFHLAFRFR